MKLKIAWILLLLCFVSPAVGQLSTKYDEGVLKITIRADGTNDDTWFGQAVTLCNAWSGPSEIRLVGPSLELTSQHDLTGDTAIIGDTPATRLDWDVSGTTQFITYNLSFDPGSQSQFTLSDVAAGDAIVNVSGGTAPVKGDWVVLWSHDNIDGISPHWDGPGGYGNGQHPETMQLVQEAYGNKVILSDPVPFAMTSAALARGCIIPSSTLGHGVVLKNLVLNWSGGSAPPSYSTAFRFVAIDGLRIENVTTTRDCPGAFWFDYCSNVTIEGLAINGSAATDGIYGVIFGPCNGVVMKGPLIKGCRHGITTSAGQNVTQQNVTVDSVDETGDKLVKTSHGWIDGYHLTVVGTLGDLPQDTPLWIVNATTDDFQLALTPGGSPINITGTTNGGSVYREERWGTPMNVVVTDGVFYSMPKWNDSTTTTTRQEVDTHAEGYRFLFENCRFISNNDQDGVSSPQNNIVAQSRSYGTTFRGCVFDGGNAGADVGVRLLAAKCEVSNCLFRGTHWYGVEVTRVNTSSPLTTDYPDDCRIWGNRFENSYGYAVRHAYGDGVLIANNTFTDCGDTQGGSPFHSKSIIAILRGTGHRVWGNQLAKDTNVTALDMYQLTTGDIDVSGNNLTGYGSGVAGFGRILPVLAWDDTNDRIQFTTSHGWEDNDQIQFTGTLPTELSAGTVYYVDKYDQDEIQISASSGPGSPIDFDDQGGSASAQNGTVDEFETAYAGKNLTD